MQSGHRRQGLSGACCPGISSLRVFPTRCGWSRDQNMALNLLLDIETPPPRRPRDRDDITPSMASESPPPAPPPPPFDPERAGPPRDGPPPRPPRLRARYMHMGRIISGTEGVMMKMWEELEGSEAGVPLSACSLAVFGRNGRISTPATNKKHGHHYYSEYCHFSISAPTAWNSIHKDCCFQATTLLSLVVLLRCNFTAIKLKLNTSSVVILLLPIIYYYHYYYH